METCQGALTQTVLHGGSSLSLHPRRRQSSGEQAVTGVRREAGEEIPLVPLALPPAPTRNTLESSFLSVRERPQQPWLCPCKALTPLDQVPLPWPTTCCSTLLLCSSWACELRRLPEPPQILVSHPQVRDELRNGP